MISIRPAQLNDLDAITTIYNDAILNSTATFDTVAKSREEQLAWFNDHGQRYAILVAEADSRVIGWAALSRWSDRFAYAGTAEVSVYVDEGHRGRGTGRKLTNASINQARKAGLHTLIARIAEGNDASIHLCRSLGFRHIGTMEEVGWKFGKLLGVHLMQIMLE
jgi:L-amino acid N-acyltransferase YncA